MIKRSAKLRQLNQELTARANVFASGVCLAMAIEYPVLYLSWRRLQENYGMINSNLGSAIRGAFAAEVLLMVGGMVVSLVLGAVGSPGRRIHDRAALLYAVSALLLLFLFLANAALLAGLRI